MNEKYKQKNILFLAANPTKTTSLRLQEEEREIKEKLRYIQLAKFLDHAFANFRGSDFEL